MTDASNASFNSCTCRVTLIQGEPLEYDPSHCPVHGPVGDDMTDDAQHRIVDCETTVTVTDSRKQAKRIVTTLVDRGKPFSVFPEKNGWAITVGCDGNHLPGAMGRWMDT